MEGLRNASRHYIFIRAYIYKVEDNMDVFSKFYFILIFYSQGTWNAKSFASII